MILPRSSSSLATISATPKCLARGLRMKLKDEEASMTLPRSLRIEAMRKAIARSSLGRMRLAKVASESFSRVVSLMFRKKGYCRSKWACRGPQRLYIRKK